MIEDALGLKIYHWKIVESEKKLLKTEENMRQSESLRREIAPRIKFLKKQVEKVEQARALRDELGIMYGDYLIREETYIKHTREKLHGEKETLERELHEANEALAHADSLRGVHTKDSAEVALLVSVRAEMGAVRRERDDLGRKIGRFEGMIEFEERRMNAPQEAHEKTVSADEAENLAQNLYDELGYAESSEDYLYIKGVVSATRNKIGKFLEHIRGSDGESADSRLGRRLGSEAIKALEDLRIEHKNFLVAQQGLEDIINGFEARMRDLEATLEAKRAETTDAERASFEFRAKKQELTLRLGMVREHIENFARDEISFREELREGGILVGRSILDYTNNLVDIEQALAEPRAEQEARRKKIERTKIRLEDIMGGGSGEDIMREYEEAVSRDEFLAKELEDLRMSAESLRDLMRGLEEELGTQFKDGIKKINKQFGEFFALMFGGGTASLEVAIEKKKKRSDTEIVENPEELEDEEAEEGIEVAISLPHKKIRGLQMLSGGERALTSIALIFAVSQVNPPPFLVLDETDAALDEANSKKYGDMVATLAKYSQLIVITHNRETMSRAGIIYGVTMGSDAISKLLSIKFEEAEALAK